MKEFNIDVYGRIYFPSLKELPSDQVVYFTLSKNLTITGNVIKTDSEQFDYTM